MATKPIRTQAKQVAAFIGSTPTRRVQSFDYSSNFTTDSVFEMGNAGIVEDSVELVETSVTANSNEWGTTDAEAMMFGIYEQRNVLKNVYNTVATIMISSRGAGGDWTVATTGAWLQVIRFNSTATTNDTEYVKVSDRAYAGGSIKVTLDSVARLTAAATGGDVVCLVNGYTITQDTVDANPVHIALPHRYSTTATTIMHTIALPRCYVDNLTYRIDTGGAAEQNYTLVGEEERLLLGSRREMQTITGSFIGYDTTAGSLTFTVPQDSLAAAGSPYVLYADSNLVTYSAGTITHSSGAVTVQAYIGGGLGIDSSSQLVYYYTNMNKKGWRGLTNIDSTIGKLTKGYVDVYFLKGSGAETSSDKLLRCTGIDISVPLTRESIEELGESRTVGKPLEGNLRNELTLTFSKNDLREYAVMNGAIASFNAETLTEILMVDLKSVTDMKVVVKFYNHQTTHNSTTLLKTFTFTGASFIGDNATTPITGATGLELRFSTQTVNIVGSGLPPMYS